MAKEIKIIDYDLENDILFISNGEMVKFSLDIGDFVLDIDRNKLICSVEINEASERLGIDRKFLGAISSINMFVNYGINNIYILLKFGFGIEKETNVQIPLSVNLGHKRAIKETLIHN